MEGLLNTGKDTPEAPASQEGAENPQKFAIQLPGGLTEDYIIGQSDNFHKTWLAGTSKKRTEAEAFHKLFDGESDAPQKSKNKVFLSVISSIVDTLASRTSKGTLGRDKLVDLIPLDIDKDPIVVKYVEDFINQNLIYTTRGQQKSKSILRAAIIEGSGFYKDYWHICRETRNTPQYTIDPLTGQQVYMGDQPQTLEYGEWRWDEVNPTDCFYDPSAATIEESPYLGLRATMSLNELRIWESQGKLQNVDRIANITPSGVSNREDWEKKRAEANTLGGNFAYGGNREYLVDTWYGTLTWKTTDEAGNAVWNSGDFTWIVVEKKYLVKFGPNDLMPNRKPGGSFPFGIEPRQVWGKSALKHVKPLQDLINTFGGVQVDLVQQVGNKPIYYDSRSGLDAKTWQQRTQGLIPVDNVDGIKEGQTDPTAVGVNQNFLNFLISFARDMTAATEQAQGLNEANMTATEFQGLAAMVGNRIDDIIDNLFQYWIAPLGQACLESYQQFGVDGQMVVRESSIDGKPMMITRQMLAGRWKVVPASGSSEANKAQRVKEDNDFLSQMLAFNQAAMANPMQTGGKLYDIGKHITEVSLALRDMKNVNDFMIELPPPPPVAAFAEPGSPETGNGNGVGGGSPLPMAGG